ncbi:MAG: hypothetical protein EBR30_22005 [Cytophagia bacterium]|nr:hypothetical protein [Cytophagia bacterium]
MSLDLFVFIHSVGLPIASACIGGYFVFLTLKYILAGVTSSINGIANIITQLEQRVDNMNTQLQRIDIKITHSLGLEPDYDRIARAEKSDNRKD